MGWERPKRPLRTCQGLQMARRVHVYGPMEPLGVDFEVELARRTGFRYALVVLRAYPTARTLFKTRLGRESHGEMPM